MRAAAGTGTTGLLAGLVLGGLVLGGTGAGAGGPGGPLTVRTVEVVSGPAAVGPCVSGFLAGAEASPALAGGRSAQRPVVAWQTDATHGGNGAITTESSGVTSTLGALPAGSCTAGRPAGELAQAPSLARAADGAAWAVTARNGSGGAEVVVSRHDGQGWTSTVVDRGPDLPTFFAQPPTIATDPVDPAVAHVAYVENYFPLGTVGRHRATRDGGRTWSEESVIAVGAPTPFAYDFAEQLVALPGGRLLSLSTEVAPGDVTPLRPDRAPVDLTQAPVVVRARQSTDGGRTWSLPVTALALENGAVRDPERPGTALRSLVRPSVAVDALGGVLVAGESVAADGTRSRLLVTRSPDGGGTWTPPRAAAQVPGLGLAAAVAVDGLGRLAASWLDLSGDVRGDAPLTARWTLTWSGDGGATWSAPQPLSAPFDLRPMRPVYVGDQGALLGLQNGFAAATVTGTGRGGDPSEVVLTTLG